MGSSGVGAMTVAFMFAIAQYCRGLDSVAVDGCDCPGETAGQCTGKCEASFSWAQCDSCGSTLGGDRMGATGLWSDGARLCQIDMQICVDCIQWHANGEAPDTWAQSP
jgi:hypothetical protein